MKKVCSFFTSEDISIDNTDKYLKWTKEQYGIFLNIVSAIPERETLPTLMNYDVRESNEIDKDATIASRNLCQYIRGNKQLTLDQILKQFRKSSYINFTSCRRDQVSLALKEIITQLEFTFDELYFLIVSAILESSISIISVIFHTCLPLLKQRALLEDKILQSATLENNALLCQRDRIRNVINSITFNLEPFIAAFSTHYHNEQRLHYNSPDVALSKMILNGFFSYGQQRRTFKDFLIFLRDFSCLQANFLQSEENPYNAVFQAIQAYYSPPSLLFSGSPNPQIQTIFQLDSMKYPLSSFSPYSAVNYIYNKLLEIFPFEEFPLQLSEAEKQTFKELGERAKVIMQTPKTEQETTPTTK